MKALGLIPLALIAAPLSAQDAASAMAGEWLVDLRLSLEDDEYTQVMVLDVAEDGGVTGTFYQAEIEDGHAGTAQERTCVSFRTSDGSGNYHHSACLVDGKMIGQTWAEGREFVLPWTAERP
ncbi:hypothetical protein OZN62_04195 [Aurantiacibacter sp. MUD11]|uniref:hypothetical protein n=1 Tax=Aurantiacibacter sp. MUD11 TaxID=3003265 RepID=UPI0022AAA942|nr:hypothetical protein [Aurantiacibacter sp. MUD11]WAT18778.1 hypothetical protein OZN62_04195 [Aurantiacibacter sp. MUD11]